MGKVLIVDDAIFVRQTIKNILEKNGHEVVGEAENGLVGLEKYKELQPDVVTLDITMPEMSGIDALKAIRQFDNRAKIIIISAMGQEDLVKEAVINGAKTFIVKPFKEEQVVKTIKKILES